MVRQRRGFKYVEKLYNPVIFMIPDAVLALVLEEQKNQHGSFVPNVDSYLGKIAKNAELLTRQDALGLLGYVFFYCNSSDKNFSYITLIGTASRAQGKGIAYDLVNEVFSLSRERGFSSCRLEVRKENFRALDFYRKVGFVVLEDRSDRYLMNMSLV